MPNLNKAYGFDDLLKMSVEELEELSEAYKDQLWELEQRKLRLCADIMQLQGMYIESIREWNAENRKGQCDSVEVQG